MPKYLYQARDAGGRSVSGKVEAANEEDSLDVLQRQGLTVTSIRLLVSGEKSAEAKKSTASRRMHNNAKTDDMILFSRELAVLIRAGVTILKSLEILSLQCESKQLEAALAQMRRDIEGGLSLKDGFAKHPKIFGSFWVNIAEVGESSGQLPHVLEQMATYMESTGQLRRKVLSALFYPAILVVVALAVVMFFLLFMVPTFTTLFSRFNAQLPSITQFVVTLSQIVRYLWWVILAGLGSFIFFIYRYWQTPSGRRVMDGLVLKLPILGDILRRVAITRVTTSLHTLLSSGVPLLYALDITEKTSGNAVLEEVFSRIKTDVRKGSSVSKPMEESGFFPLMVVYMTRVGEETGELARMMGEISKFYQQRLDATMDRISTLVEPVMLVFMGGVVGFLAVSMFLPIFDIATNVRAGGT